MRAIVIPARYGSSRFPGKPLVRIAGKPLIQWVYEAATSSSAADEVVVATDDERIARCVESFGGRAVLTPQCPTGTDRVAWVAKNEGANWRFVVNLQGDEPLITAEAIDAVFEALDETPNSIVTLKKRIEDGEDYADPNVVKVVTDVAGFALYFSRSPIPYIRKKGVAYRHIGVYGFSREVLLRFVGLPQSTLEIVEQLEQLRALENGIPIRVLETDYEAVGVDVPEDVERVEKLLRGER